ncbi:hypothetical protein ACIQGZ_25435 [Streptomyces sp. NPDC092296]|uniref:hypothetical protein n=1 Tax=Streptomyces sp. NPDC092296 TaxID=3366012 RepID=UPI00382C8800
MPSRPRLALSAGVLATAVVTGAPCAWAGGVVDPAPIGPGQYFTGLVNGSGSGAVIQMACFGPLVVGQTGHPLAGQTVTVLPASASSSSKDVGYTGSANAVDVVFGVSASSLPLTLRTYAVRAAIPTSLTLPCYGTGTVAFVPNPSSPTALPAYVTVTYASQP